MHLPNGTLLRGGMYQIVGFIASGGFGCTYKALHPMLEKKVAIKEFFPKSLCNRDSDTSQVTVGTLSQKPLLDKLKKKFIQEARSIAKLSHPGIVKVSDVFEENGTAYYVMDYIEGKSLGKIINERGPLSEKEALDYIRQVCQALDYVHKQNRLHLDLKPGNIMIDDCGRAILIDFGASKQYDEENGENTSTLVGKTPGFAPIEQMGSDVSGFKPATDIYALGATLYKCLTGKTPLESTQLANGEELDPLPSNVSESTKKAICAAMQVGSKKRPQSIEEFLTLLNQSNTLGEKSEDTLYDTSDQKVSSESNKKAEGPIAYEPTNKAQKAVYKIPLTPSNPINPSVSAPKDDHQNKLNTNLNKAGLESTKSSKTKVYLGIAIFLIIGIITWMLFDNTFRNLHPTLAVSVWKDVKVGDVFEVKYILNEGKGKDFQVNYIEGCLKVSGPEISKTSRGTEYSFTYRAEKEGTYIIPSASIRVGGKKITSPSSEIYIQPKEISKSADDVTISSESLNLQLKDSGTINGHGYVDLDLPSGLKWASCNVGAAKPEDYGSYFEWGETRTKSVYNGRDSETYDKDNQWLKSHGYIDGSGNLTLSHDAAHKKWGGSWRMPTESEIWELVNNTTAKWTNLNGKYGQLVTSKKNGNSIFLPAAGCFNGTSPGLEGELGYYWSSTPDMNNIIGAYGLKSKSGDFDSSWNYRGLGCSVRPISK